MVGAQRLSRCGIRAAGWPASSVMAVSNLFGAARVRRVIPGQHSLETGEAGAGSVSPPHR
jgi:hypothetical protein